MRKKWVTIDDLGAHMRLLFLCLAQDDLIRSSEAAETALRIERPAGWRPGSIYLGMSDSAIIRYARPFMGNDLPGGQYAVQLPKGYLPSGTEPFHRSIMELRHKFGAHSDMNERDVKLQRVARSDGSQSWEFKSLSAYVQPADLSTLNNLAKHIALAICKEIEKIADDLFPNAPKGGHIGLSGRRTPMVPNPFVQSWNVPLLKDRN